MSPLARSLLALAAAALLHGAAGFGDPRHCATVVDGDEGVFQWDVMDEHTDQKDNVIDLPPDRCPLKSHKVGVEVTVCNPLWPPPEVTLMDAVDKRVYVRCLWGQGQTCPQGLNIKVRQNCAWN